MKLNCKRIDFTYTPGEEIFNFPEESGLPFIFDVEEELTGDPAVMDAVGEMLDEAEKLAEKAKTAIKAALEPQPDEEAKNAYFFVTDLKGNYYYAHTLAEHNANCKTAAAVNKSLKN